MGQSLSTAVGYILLFFYRLSENTKNLFTKEYSDRSYYNKDNLIKDDEQQADILSSEDINKIIKKQQNMKKNSQIEVNMNEYKMIKNPIEMDDADCLENKTMEDSKEIQDLHLEVLNLQVEDDLAKEHEDVGDINEDFENLKAAIMNHN